MSKITEERIDKAIDSAFLEINEYFLDDFQKNNETFDKLINDATNKQHPEYVFKIALDFATFKTARDHCIEIFRNVLKELLCE